MSTSQSKNIQKQGKDIMQVKAKYEYKYNEVSRNSRSQHSNELTLHLQFNIVRAEFVFDICRSFLIAPELENYREKRLRNSIHKLNNSFRSMQTCKY